MVFRKVNKVAIFGQDNRLGISRRFKNLVIFGITQPQVFEGLRFDGKPL